MSIYSLKTADAAQINATLSANIVHYEATIVVYSKAIEAFAKFNGKAFSKRFETALLALLPNNAVHTEKSKHDFINDRIYVWGDGIEFGKRISIYDMSSNKPFDYNKFKDEATHEIERRKEWINQAQNGMDASERLAKIWNDRIKDLTAVHNELNSLGIHLG